ncbi:hypothetical protein VCRA2121O157_30241 [Vibrio crassostreae]|nr:hypothetical protein VCRA2113O140_30066 [Vibrio crassostreae]CAK2084542.1 hypothetical protein VCRA2113O138_30241 [Vibrio crassostreae]CAK2935585.1 hypothetical protein VCRA2121O154_30063 [Vibrio crassostreae]CAK2950196.1 hypothetical protein VCRA2113O139_30241 [Vibrio crassostreae]CAK2958322.1 hypothetical protein VCRA2119O148_30241 [Vibrio crassostreae]
MEKVVRSAFSVENIGKSDGYQAEFTSQKSVNQESVYVRISHEF